MMNNNKNQVPIFIVGCPRSGTTLLRLILDSHPHISCGPETKFLVDFNKIVNQYWSTVKLFSFDKLYWYHKTADFFNSFQQEYLEKRGKKRWAEKTPAYTMNLDFINFLFPNCQIVHIIRDGRDVVASHRSRWGYKSSIKAITRWSQYITYARNFGKTITPDRYIEIRYEALICQTETTLKTLFEYLNEPWDSIVLRYDQVDHDVNEVYKISTEAHHQEHNYQSLIYSSQIGVGERNLDWLLKTLFYWQNGKLLKELGYK